MHPAYFRGEEEELEFLPQNFHFFLGISGKTSVQHFLYQNFQNLNLNLSVCHYRDNFMTSRTILHLLRKVGGGRRRADMVVIGNHGISGSIPLFQNRGIKIVKEKAHGYEKY